MSRVVIPHKPRPVNGARDEPVLRFQKLIHVRPREFPILLAGVDQVEIRHPPLKT